MLTAHEPVREELSSAINYTLTMKTRLVFLGPPGAGKGTQALLIAKKYEFTRIATGDILREAIRKGDELGHRAKEYMDRGALVPDEVVNEILREKLESTQDGFIIDGYPRTIDQANFLQSVVDIERVIYFDAPEDVLVQRIVNRLVCPVCNAVYNRLDNPPAKEGICDADGSALVHRTDDVEEVTRDRIETFWQKTAPLVDFYFHKGLLAKVSAERNVTEVTSEIEQAISAE